MLFKDAESDASFKLRIRKKEIDFEFLGQITESTLKNVFEEKKNDLGWIKGDFRARILKDQPRQSTAQGSLSGENFVFP